MGKYRYEPMLKLKFMRLKMGYTIVSLAEKVGIHYNTLCDYESGKHRPSVDTLKQIAKVLECDISDIA